MRAINLSTALTMSLFFLISWMSAFGVATPLTSQSLRGGVVIVIEPFAAEPVEFSTPFSSKNGTSTQAYTLQIHDENGELHYQVTTQSIHFNLPSNVLTNGATATITSNGFYAQHEF